MTFTPYIGFDGRCLEAFEFYAQCFGGKIAFKMTYADAPMPAPPGWGDKIMHASLSIGDQILSGADAPPDRYQLPKGMSIAFSVKEVSEAERIYAALAEGASIEMPLQETFWAQRFGMLRDRFGTPWMINCEKSRA